MKKFIIFISIVAIITGSSKVVISAAQSYGGVFFKNSSKLKKVALTFDDGPHPRYTEQILSILKQYNITATFFIIGINAENYPETLKTIANTNCEIANHTFSHKNVRNMSSEEIKNEILRCEEAIFNIAGVHTALFRPPEGACVSQVKSAVKNLNYNMILWSIDTRDWAHNPSQAIADDIISNIKDGDIILMHDYISGINTTCEALRIIIPKLLNEGYEFVTVSELIQQ